MRRGFIHVTCTVLFVTYRQKHHFRGVILIYILSGSKDRKSRHKYMYLKPKELGQFIVSGVYGENVAF